MHKRKVGLLIYLNYDVALSCSAFHHINESDVMMFHDILK